MVEHFDKATDLLKSYVGRVLDSDAAESISKQFYGELKSSVLELFNSNINSGMLATYRNNDIFPLYTANDSLLAMLGYERDEFMRLFADDAACIIHPEDRADHNIRQALDNVQLDSQVQIRLLRKDGSSIWVYEQLSTGHDEQGKPLIIGVFSNITELIELQLELQLRTTALQVSEQRFRIALERSSNIIFEYDIPLRRLLRTSAVHLHKDIIIDLEELESQLIDDARIEEGCVSSLITLFDGAAAGRPSGECIIRSNHLSGSNLWHKVSLAAIHDADDRPVRAVGIIEDITQQCEAELAYAREEQYRQVLLADALGFYTINLTRGLFERCETYSAYVLDTPTNTPYESMMSYTAMSKMDESDQRNFLDVFSRSSLLERFASGIVEVKLDYKIHNTDGTSKWLRNTLHMMLDPISRELKGFLYVNDIDKTKRDELELMRRSERDPMTGVYNKLTVEQFIHQRLQTLEAMQTGVFMMIDVDNFKSINDSYGHPFGDKTLVDAVNVIANCFRDGDLIGRIGGDEFCVFFTGMRSRKRVELSAIAICEGIKNIFDPDTGRPGVSCSIGISMCAGTPKTFEELYYEADKALYVAKGRGRNCYAFSPIHSSNLITSGL